MAELFAWLDKLEGKEPFPTYLLMLRQGQPSLLLCLLPLLSVGDPTLQCLAFESKIYISVQFLSVPSLPDEKL